MTELCVTWTKWQDIDMKISTRCLLIIEEVSFYFGKHS